MCAKCVPKNLQELGSLFFPLSYPTLGSIRAFTPANMRAPVDALETKMPTGLDSWIAGLAQTSREADASGGGGGDIDSHCISGHGANNPHQRQLDTLNTSDAPLCQSPKTQNHTKALTGSRSTFNRHFCTELTEPELDGKQR